MGTLMHEPQSFRREHPGAGRRLSNHPEFPFWSGNGSDCILILPARGVVRRFLSGAVRRDTRYEPVLPTRRGLGRRISTIQRGMSETHFRAAQAGGIVAGEIRATELIPHHARVSVRKVR